LIEPSTSSTQTQRQRCRTAEMHLDRSKTIEALTEWLEMHRFCLEFAVFGTVTPVWPIHPERLIFVLRFIVQSRNPLYDRSACTRGFRLHIGASVGYYINWWHCVKDIIYLRQLVRSKQGGSYCTYKYCKKYFFIFILFKYFTFNI
jgi:hypothetical protein